MSSTILYDYFPSYLPQIHINDVVNGAHFKFAVSVPVSGSSERFRPSVLDLTLMALYSFGHTLRVTATPPLRHNRCCYSWLENCSTEGLLKTVGFLLMTFILCFSAIVSEYWSGSTSFQKQTNENQICLVLFLFRKLFQMHPGTRLESQFCNNSFK